MRQVIEENQINKVNEMRFSVCMQNISPESKKNQGKENFMLGFVDYEEKVYAVWGDLSLNSKKAECPSPPQSMTMERIQNCHSNM